MADDVTRSDPPPAGPTRGKPRCQAAVYKRDVPRRTGRGPSGFEVHWSRDQCKRAAVVGDLCRQHAKRPDCGRANYFRTL